MKKIVLSLFIVFFVSAFSNEKGVNTVAQAKMYNRGENVVLVGKIVNNISGIDYLFEDETGSIVVKIEQGTWEGMTINPEDTVKIYGAADSDFVDGPKVWVDRIVLMK